MTGQQGPTGPERRIGAFSILYLLPFPRLKAKLINVPLQGVTLEIQVLNKLSSSKSLFALLRIISSVLSSCFVVCERISRKCNLIMLRQEAAIVTNSVSFRY